MVKETIKNMQLSTDKKAMIIALTKIIIAHLEVIRTMMLPITNNTTANNTMIQIMLSKNLLIKQVLLILNSNQQEERLKVILNIHQLINNTIKTITTNITNNIIREQQQVKEIMQHITNSSNSIMLVCQAMNSLNQTQGLILHQVMSKMFKEISKLINNLGNDLTYIDNKIDFAIKVI